MQLDGQSGTYFAVWAPNAAAVSVVGEFNHWSIGTPLEPVHSSGVWAGFIAGVGKGALYKYRIDARDGRVLEKADPFGFHHETPPRTASVVWDLDYEWQDQDWMADRHRVNALGAPISVYEVHLGSWMRVPEEGNRSLSYRELAERLIPYVKALGFTHIELMPIMEHPFFGSWGYQVTGYFAATSRYGTPQDLMAFIDACHHAGLGVILDWVPSHFPTDGHGLAQFDGTHLYEHEDPRQGFHPDWQSAIFNYGRNEVRSFLTSSAIFWLKMFHADGLRVDGVASMLYLDYSREEGQWIPNRYGGRENIDALELLRQLNRACYAECPDIQMMAEESTAWSGVSRPTDVGGLGFGLKWDMGWMHDTLKYFSRDPIHRGYHQNELTFRGVYALNENFLLPLSHDEVVHGKGSLLGKMPGDDWQKLANLRLGAEFGQWTEWNHDSSLDWHLTQHQRHAQVQALVVRLNELYRSEGALYEIEFEAEGFRWVRLHDSANAVLAYLRRGKTANDWLLIVVNCTPVARTEYRLGIPQAGNWREIFNSDATEFGGSGFTNGAPITTEATACDELPQSLLVSLSPLGLSILKPC
jgi:1,4-alpha-glucan branching enzyme